jgi:hypothetical protein
MFFFNKLAVNVRPSSKDERSVKKLHTKANANRRSNHINKNIKKFGKKVKIRTITMLHNHI